MKQELSEKVSDIARGVFNDQAEKGFNLSELLQQVEEEYQSDGDIVSLLKQIHQEVKDLKSYIMKNISSDKSIYKVNSL